MPQLLQNFHYYTAISAPTFQLAMQMCSLEKLKLEIHCHLPRKLHFFLKLRFIVEPLHRE